MGLENVRGSHGARNDKTRTGYEGQEQTSECCNALIHKLKATVPGARRGPIRVNATVPWSGWKFVDIVDNLSFMAANFPAALQTTGLGGDESYDMTRTTGARWKGVTKDK